MLAANFTESSCVTKETIVIDILNILITSGNGDRKIMQPIKIRSETPTRISKWNQFS